MFQVNGIAHPCSAIVVFLSAALPGRLRCDTAEHVTTNSSVDMLDSLLPNFFRRDRLTKALLDLSSPLLASARCISRGRGRVASTKL